MIVDGVAAGTGVPIETPVLSEMDQIRAARKVSPSAGAVLVYCAPMEHCLARLHFVKDYIGIIRAQRCPDPDVYTRLQLDATITAHYFQNPQKRALWLAFAGEHIDPLAAWFRSAHRVLKCTSVVAAALANGQKVPSGKIDALFIRRADTTPDVFDGLIQEEYMIYLAHTDEFLVLRPALKRHLGVAAKTIERVLDLKRCRRVSRATGMSLQSAGKEPYDPIFKQIREVTGPIGHSASQAASDLVREWKLVLQEEPPADIREFEAEVKDTINRITTLAEHTPSEEALAVIDQLAMSLRQKQRAAFELLSSIRDFEWPPKSPTMTYERAATRLMLRAAKQYALDVARRLDLDEYDFLPVLGRDFDVHPGQFAIQVKAHTEYSTVILEFPAELRLRLGALPMMAHEIARMREREVEHMADLLAEEENNPDLQWLFGGSHRSRGTEEGRERRRQSLREMGKQLAADLLAVAAVGPQYVYAVARFAVGTLGDFNAAAQRNQLSLSSRISACLGFLNTHDIVPTFESPYFTDGPKNVPDPVRRIVNDAVPRIGQAYGDIEAIAATLRDGRIADGASPASILAALWDGVVRRTGYVHEIAALISIASEQSV